MNSARLRELLRQVRSGEVGIEDAFEELRDLPFAGFGTYQSRPPSGNTNRKTRGDLLLWQNTGASRRNRGANGESRAKCPDDTCHGATTKSAHGNFSRRAFGISQTGARSFLESTSRVSQTRPCVGCVRGNQRYSRCGRSRCDGACFGKPLLIVSTTLASLDYIAFRLAVKNWIQAGSLSWSLEWKARWRVSSQDWFARP